MDCYVLTPCLCGPIAIGRVVRALDTQMYFRMVKVVFHFLFHTKYLPKRK